MTDSEMKNLVMFVTNWLSTFPPYCDELTNDALFARNASKKRIEMIANGNPQLVIDALNKVRPEDLYLLGATW